VAGKHGQVVVPITKGADLEIYFRPSGSVEAGHIQRANLALLKHVAEHGRLPDFPPGWFVTVERGVAVSVDEDSGLRESSKGCISAGTTHVFVSA
jgi:hypothetical protein